MVYWQTGNEVDMMYNIPDKNTAFLLLGKGTSITDAAVRTLSESGVVIGFAGNGGSPLFVTTSPIFFETQSEYRPTEYMQGWAKKWFDESLRLKVAQSFLEIRLNNVLKYWKKYYPSISIPEEIVQRFTIGIKKSETVTQLLSVEAVWAKALYAILAKYYSFEKFKRQSGGMEQNDQSVEEMKGTNALLDHGNYIAYGYAASALTTLGISYAFPVLHGKTRRWDLVFDVADLIKDDIVMPLSFESGKIKMKDKDFRETLINRCWEVGILNEIIDVLKNTSSECK